jgi:MerR family transcriptional regulator, light-induced transcriptional regulator
VAWRIKTVAERTGVRSDTLRAWERRYGLVEPVRSDKGYRLYSDDDIAVISKVKQLVDGGLSIGEAVEQARREGLIGAPPPPRRDRPAEGGAIRATRSALLQATAALDRPRADAILAAQLPISHERTLREVLLPLVREIASLHARSKASIAQERFAAQWVRERICAMLVQVGGGPVDGPEALCAGPPGEPSDLGLLGSSLHLALRGWRVTYLGGGFPTEELTSWLQERRPPLLLTSLVRQRPEPDRRELLRQLRAVAPAATTVVAGGPGARGDGSPVAGISIARSFDDLPSPPGRTGL